MKRGREEESLSSSFFDTKRSRSSHSLVSPSSSSDKAFHDFADSLAEKNRHLIHVEIPRRIVALQRVILNFPPFEHVIPWPETDERALLNNSDKSTINNSHKEINVKEMKTHDLLTKTLLPQLHEETTAFLRILSSIKLGIQLNMPPVEDASNFGAEIQEEGIGELSRYEDLHFSTLERILSFSSNRAKIFSKIIKYPHIHDYWLSVRELDENTWLDTKMTLMEVRNHLITVHDMLIKNEERLKGEASNKHSGAMTL